MKFCGRGDGFAGEPPGLLLGFVLGTKYQCSQLEPIKLASSSLVVVGKDPQGLHVRYCEVAVADSLNVSQIGKEVFNHQRCTEVTWRNVNTKYITLLILGWNPA